MLNDDFLSLYNDELRYFRQAGEQFSRENPQVAGHLGMHNDGVLDPFVERLLEGTAFLSTRIQQRLNYEQPEFALNMLDKLAPYWYTPVPSIATLAVRPDMAYPQWNARTELPRGSKVVLSDPSLNGKTATFTTGTALHVQPVVIEEAACTLLPPTTLPEGVARSFQQSQAHLKIRISTRGVMPVSELAFTPLRLTVVSDLVKTHQLLTLLLNHTKKMVVWGKNENQIVSEELDARSLRLGGLRDEDALLPQAIGELPGCRLLREYFAAPGRFCTLEIDGLMPFLRQCERIHEFELYFLLDQRLLTLLDRVDKQDFSLFATPVINLYRRHCSPILLNPDRVEHPLVVDKLNVSLYEVHSICQVKGVDREGNQVPLAAMQGDRRYLQQHIPTVWSLRRCREPRASRYHNPWLPEANLFFSWSSGAGGIAQDALKSLQVEARVCERHLIPAHLQQPEFQLEQTLPVHRLEIVRHPSAPHAVPGEAQAWQALQLIAVNPLRYALPRVKDCSSLLRDWLSLFAHSGEQSHLRRVESIQRASVNHRFERYRGPGPLAWTRGVEMALDVRRGNHADQGGVIFAMVLHHALSQYCELNQSLRLALALDGEPLVNWGPISND